MAHPQESCPISLKCRYNRRVRLLTLAGLFCSSSVALAFGPGPPGSRSDRAPNGRDRANCFGTGGPRPVTTKVLEEAERLMAVLER